MSSNQFNRFNKSKPAAYQSNQFTKPLWRREQHQKPKEYNHRYDYSTSNSRQHNQRNSTPARPRYQQKRFNPEYQKMYSEKRDSAKKSQYRNKYIQRRQVCWEPRRLGQSHNLQKPQKYSHLEEDTHDQEESDDEISTQPSIQEIFEQTPLKVTNKPQNDSPIQEIDLLQINSDSLAEKILELIQFLNYNNLTDIIEKEFLEVCKDHVYFIGGKPQSKNAIGEALLKNGLFHEMWSKILLKSTVFDQDIIIPVYYEKYKDKIQKNTTNFQIAFNPIPESPSQIQQFKRYRKLFDTSANFTTKLHCMKLYEEIRRQIRDQQSEQLGNLIAKRKCSWQIVTAEMQIGAKQKELQPQDQSETIKTLNKIGYQMDPDTKIITAKRQKSPQTGRFRLMQQTQTNERRMAVQMACLFLNIDRIFHISDVDIIRVRECYKNDKVQLAVIQGYVAEYDKNYKKMKIQPKQKTLVAAYKFAGLEQLIRIEKTYGQIYGLIVYDEHLDIKKYLDNIEKCRTLSGL